MIPILSGEIIGTSNSTRVGAARCMTKVITKDGKDVTKQYLKGAEESLF